MKRIFASHRTSLMNVYIGCTNADKQRSYKYINVIRLHSHCNCIQQIQTAQWAYRIRLCTSEHIHTQWWISKLSVCWYIYSINKQKAILKYFMGLGLGLNENSMDVCVAYIWWPIWSVWEITKASRIMVFLVVNITQCVFGPYFDVRISRGFLPIETVIFLFDIIASIARHWINCVLT